MLPFYLKSEVRPLLRAAAAGLTLLILLIAWIFWQLSGAHVDGLALSFNQTAATIFGYPLAPFKSRDIGLRIECVAVVVVFLGFAAWSFALVFRPSTFWTIAEDRIEHRTGRGGVETWTMSSVVAVKRHQYHGKVRDFWTIKLRLKNGKWLRLPWIASREEAEALIEKIKSLIAQP